MSTRLGFVTRVGPVLVVVVGMVSVLLCTHVYAQQRAFVATADAALRSQPGATPNAVPGCPSRGGLLDSISVPVGQPLTLVIQLGAPAPRGGATFQLSSDDPSIVAAGDRRQGFLPRVFIAEGQMLSNAFSIFGIKVGGTRLRLVPLTAGFSSSSFPLGAWDLNKGGEERFVDANAASSTCRANAGSPDLSTDPNRLSQCGVPVKGIAADGVSRLLLRGVSGLPGTLCYEITSTSETGQGQGQIATAVLNTQQVGSLQYGVSAYKAPDSFDDTADFRKLEVEVTFTPSIGNGNTTRFRAETKIVRPPVVLIHGVWSSRSAWSGDYVKDNLHRTTFTADYAGTNGARYATNSPRVRGFIADGLKAARDKGFAATQADVLGHSMGGILTRLHIGSNQFKRPDNFGQGDVRRLITLNTPHSGSTFGNMVTGLHGLKPAATNSAVQSITGFNPAGGAVCDLAENSPALAGLNSATTIKAQAITGTGGPTGTAATPARFFGGFLSFGNIEGELTKKVCVRRNAFFICVQEEFVFPQDVVDAFRFRQANDTIVARVSQQGGHCSVAGLAGVNFGNVIHSGPGVVDGVLSVGAVATRAYQLLDGPVTGFADSFPGVASTSLGAACTVPGRGVGQDAQDHANQCGTGGGLNRTSLPGLLATPQSGQRTGTSHGRSTRMADNRVQIISPAAGQVFAPGDTVAITVSLTAPLVANDIGVQVPGFNSLPGTNYNGATYQTSFTVPEFFAGPLRFTPAVTDTANQPIEGPEVLIVVRSPVAPVSVAFQQRNYRLTPLAIGTVEGLALAGFYPGAVQRDISSAAAGTTYASSDSAVVSVDADGQRQVLATGIAVITARNFGLSDQTVFVIEDPVSPLPASDVTVQLPVQMGGLRLDRATGFYVQTLTVTNPQSVPLAGPLVLVLSGLPGGVNLVSQSGLTQNVRVGSPYLSLPLVSDGLTLRPGQSVTFNAQFLNPARVNFSYVPSVWRVSAQP